MNSNNDLIQFIRISVSPTEPASRSKISRHMGCLHLQLDFEIIKSVKSELQIRHAIVPAAWPLIYICPPRRLRVSGT